MKKFLKGLLTVLGVVFVLLIGGCTVSMFLVGSAVDQTVTEIEEESAEQQAIIDEIVQQMEWTIIEDEYGWKTMESVLTNNSDTKIDYVEFDIKYIKDGITIETDWTNVVDIMPGESRKIEFTLVPDEFDSYEISASEDPLN